MEYYHCATEGCKYSSSSWPAQKFIREDHVKAHIKWYGHYGPQSPGNRKKRQGSELGKDFTVSVIFEKWSIGEHAQLRRCLVSITFTSPKTELWYDDEIGEQFHLVKDGFSSGQGKNFCLERSCYYHETPPDSLPCISFASSEYLIQHGRRTGHNTSDSSGETQSSLTTTASSQELAWPATVFDLQPIYEFPVVTTEQEHSWSSSYFRPWADDIIPLSREESLPISSISPTTEQVIALQAMGAYTESINADVYTDLMDLDNVGFNESLYDNNMAATALVTSSTETQDNPHVSFNWTSLEDSQLSIRVQGRPFQLYDQRATHLPAENDKLTCQTSCGANILQNPEASFVTESNLGSMSSITPSMHSRKVGSFEQESSSTLASPTSELHDDSSIATSSSYTPILGKEGE